ncbi:hypothetical protein ACCI51_18855 [Microbulbifer echini]|uniref:Uncharacterized protein n=1 Tax=Microbulbifer echini TaxID=1529067 RepID=A0ABV4NT53_9GAMM|nr:hypothetical protein [uncultured Microbulbifer sp.]
MTDWWAGRCSRIGLMHLQRPHLAPQQISAFQRSNRLGSVLDYDYDPRSKGRNNDSPGNAILVQSKHLQVWPPAAHRLKLRPHSSKPFPQKGKALWKWDKQYEFSHSGTDHRLLFY